ncbi:MAG: CDP-alcohol phosphatidyltransferase [Terriglobia bacterium]|nr:MAG: CDP-alcohol phosphatidyltransferase [Terriglobia bacterium]
MPRWVNVANLFTAIRLILAPMIVLAILRGNDRRALLLFACAAVTDVMDGAAARHLDLVTQAGAYFDPIADKCLLSGVFVALAAAGHVPRWFVSLVLGRDVYLLFAAGFLMWLTPMRRFPPSIWGKASTFVQIVTVVLWLTRNVAPLPMLEALSAAILWPCAVFTLWSGIHYTWRGVQLARAH